MGLVNIQVNNIGLWSKIGAILFFVLFSVHCSAQSENKTVKEAKGLPLGANVPDFSATDLHDSTFTLYKALEDGPVVLIFYRGHWCPVCNRHLSQLQDSLQQIYDKGASVVAVSPEKVEFLKQTAEKTDASFRLLYDEGYKIASLFDVKFKPTAGKTLVYNTVLGANLKKNHSDQSQQLPIPATFIISTDRIVVWRHFNPNYKKRSTVRDIVENVPD